MCAVFTWNIFVLSLPLLTSLRHFLEFKGTNIPSSSTYKHLSFCPKRREKVQQPSILHENWVQNEINLHEPSTEILPSLHLPNDKTHYRAKKKVKNIISFYKSPCSIIKINVATITSLYPPPLQSLTSASQRLSCVNDKQHEQINSRTRTKSHNRLQRHFKANSLRCIFKVYDESCMAHRIK